MAMKLGIQPPIFRQIFHMVSICFQIEVLLTSFDPNQRVTLASMEESQPYKATGQRLGDPQKDTHGMKWG